MPSRLSLLLLLPPLLFLVPSGRPALAKDPPKAQLAGLSDTAIRNAVVRVEGSYARVDWSAPWKRKAPEAGSGSAFYIAGDRLLTNAHVVRDAQQLTVKRNDGSAPTLATVDAVDEDCDLAILKVADKAFFTGMHPLAFGELPAIGSSVTTYGYPLGGRELSTTTGVVSRVETIPYFEGFTQHIAAQTDAAINPGNSGGPVVQSGAVVGVAFQSIRSAQSIAYFIPVPIVRHFLDDLARGKFGAYDGFPDATFVARPLESPAERLELRLPADRSGVVVQATFSGASLASLLHPGDVLTTIDGQRIADDGTYASGAMRLPSAHLLDMPMLGQTVHLQVWRDGKAADLAWKADRYEPLDRLRHAPATPRYLVYGGLLFLPLTFESYVGTKPTKDVRAGVERALNEQIWGTAPDPAREIVILAKIFSDPVNEGESTYVPAVVERVNGKPIHDLSGLERTLDQSQNRWDVVETGAPNYHVFALDHDKVIAGLAAFLSAHGMTRDRN